MKKTLTFKRSLIKRFAVSSLLLLALTACKTDQEKQPEPPVAPEQPKETPKPKPVEPKVEPKKDPTAQKDSPKPTEEAKACRDDRGCRGFLRCIDGFCKTPPAITGEHDESTPWVEFQTSPKPSRFFMETAIPDYEQTRGLMFRREMKDDWGMIFIYPTEGIRSFWMKNTLMPLDMVFVGDDGKVVSFIEGAEPLTLQGRQSEGPARYVIELKAGWVQKHGIKKGQVMKMGNFDAQYMPRSK